MVTPIVLSTIPRPFQPVPDPESPEFESWAGKLLADDDHPTSTLAADLERLSAAIRAAGMPDRVWLAMLPAAPYQRGIPIFGWVHAAPSDGMTADALARVAAPGATSVPPTAWTRDVDVHDIGGRPGLMIHQFQTVAGSTREALVERCGVLMLDERAGLVVSIELVALDPHAVGDIAAACLDIAQRITIVEPTA